MPRKPKAIPVLIIEGISAVDAHTTMMVDDFTGESVTVQHEAKPERTSAATLRKRQQDAKQRAADRILAIAFAKPPKVELVPQGKRKLGEINGRAVLIDLPPWRRF